MKALIALALAIAPASAAAIPRFAIRTGLPCSSCHRSPAGGGMRTDFARNVFARYWLADAALCRTIEPPTLEVSERVALGTDLRAGYLFQNSPRPELNDTSSLILMQADLYAAFDAPPYLGVYLDKGAYGGFEAWGELRPYGTPDHRDLVILAGRMMLPFGLRDPNHTSYVREGIGFGATDRDNAIALSMTDGRVSTQLTLSNGTYGDAFLDTGGTERPRPYDVAVTGRFLAQPRLGPFQALLVASAMYNRNAAQQNPLFVPALFQGHESAQIPEGVNEVRLGLGAGLSLGRLLYRGEIVGVYDRFRGDDVRNLAGYASYQEIVLTALRGLDVGATYEFADSDLEFSRGRVERVGGIVEWFPIPGLELSAMVRHSFGEADFLMGARDDVTLFVHQYL